MKHTAIAVCIVVFLTLMPNCMATAQSIDEEWGKVKVRPMPVLEQTAAHSPC
jgi:Fe2+ transport system protein B